ncbi:DUF982 domain-containing protein (plasmid) [Mesorhizobium sp. B2-1-8]|nr:DUF982 domain-containing protein [Mesorhizobium sp. B2-1-8]UCI23044.1 DUF982 domain-containing protein [Mesorhizobium sp. B2-1-8]
MRTTEPGMRFNVSNAEAAAAELLKWTKRGSEWHRAVSVCMAALADLATPQEARRCFSLAANEEGVLLSEYLSDKWNQPTLQPLRAVVGWVSNGLIWHDINSCPPSGRRGRSSYRRRAFTHGGRL